MTQTLHTLLQHAEHQRDEALGALLQAEETARRLRLQSAQLLQYRDEYRQRHPAQGGRSSSMELLRCHQGFMDRLDQALVQQQGHLDGAETRTAALRAELLARETRVASVRKLIERRSQEQLRVATRQEQRRSDDAARQRRHDAAPEPAWHGNGDGSALSTSH